MDSSTESAREFARGWRIIAACLLGVALGVGVLYIYTAGLFIKPLEAEFGWSRAQVVSANAAFSLTLAATGMLSGWLVDRIGTRIVVAISVVSSAVGLWMLSLTQGSLAFYIATFILLAVFGGGTTAIPFVRLIVNWFDHARGFAIGITMVGTGLAGTLVPPLINMVINEHGWRAGYRTMAVLALLALPLVLLWGRERTAEPGEAADRIAEGGGIRLSEAIRERRFWIMGLAMAIAAATLAGLIPHLVPMLQDFGMTARGAGTIIGILGTTVMAGRMLTGFVLDRVFAPYVAAMTFAIGACAWLMLYVWGAEYAVPALLLIGFTVGAEVDIAGYMSARYFGRKHYGAIFGFQYGLFTVGGAVSPFAAAVAYDAWGSYEPVVLAAVVGLVINIPLILCMGAYPQFGSSRIERFPGETAIRQSLSRPPDLTASAPLLGTAKTNEGDKG